MALIDRLEDHESVLNLERTLVVKAIEMTLAKDRYGYAELKRELCVLEWKLAALGELSK